MSVVLLLVGCGWDDERGSPLLSQAVEETWDAGGARYVSDYFFALVDWSARVRERGVVDSRGSTAAVVETVTHERGSAPSATRARQRSFEDRSYFRVPPDPLWTAVDAPDTGFHITGLVGAGPAALEDLPHLRDVRRVGPAEVRGVDTTHFRAEVPLARLADVAEPSERAVAQRELRRLIRGGATGSGLRTDVWLDREGRVRRVDGRLSLRLPGYDPRATRARTYFFDLGRKPRIRAPVIARP